jgi:hypothetical protein
MIRTLLSICVVGLVACERNKTPPPTVTPPSVATLGSEVRATVNGVPITGLEIGARLAGAAMGASGEKANASQQRSALEQAIDEELLAQRALELGYQPQQPGDGDGGVPDAKTRESHRHDLARQFRMKELLEKTVVTPEETRAWFDANLARLQSELQVQFIIVQGKATGDVVLASLARGQSFDEVALAQFPRAPDPKPWAVQPMSWFQVPPPWWTELDKLEPGKTSGLIADQGDRYWIVKLVERKKNTAITFEASEPPIAASLRATKFEARREEVLKELRAKARIDFKGQ